MAEDNSEDKEDKQTSGSSPAVGGVRRSAVKEGLVTLLELVGVGEELLDMRRSTKPVVRVLCSHHLGRVGCVMEMRDDERGCVGKGRKEKSCCSELQSGTFVGGVSFARQGRSSACVARRE